MALLESEVEAGSQEEGHCAGGANGRWAGAARTHAYDRREMGATAQSRHRPL